MDDVVVEDLEAGGFPVAADPMQDVRAVVARPRTAVPAETCSQGSL
jgi:hypothetical protein